MRNTTVFDLDVIKKIKEFLGTIYGHHGKKTFFHDAKANSVIASKDGLRCTRTGLRDELKHPLVELVISVQEDAENICGDGTTTSGLCYLAGLTESLPEKDKIIKTDFIKKIAFLGSAERDKKILNIIKNYKGNCKVELNRKNLKKMINDIMGIEKHLLSKEYIEYLSNYFFTQGSGIRLNSIIRSKSKKAIEIKVEDEFGIDIKLLTKSQGMYEFSLVQIHDGIVDTEDAIHYSTHIASLKANGHIINFTKSIIFCRGAQIDAITHAERAGLILITLNDKSPTVTNMYFDALKNIFGLEEYSSKMCEISKLKALAALLFEKQDDNDVYKNQLSNMKSTLHLDKDASLKDIICAINKEAKIYKKSTEEITNPIYIEEKRIFMEVDIKLLNQIKDSLKNRIKDMKEEDVLQCEDLIESFNRNTFSISVNAEKFSDSGMHAFDIMDDVKKSLKKLKDSKIDFLLTSDYINDSEEFEKQGIPKEIMEIYCKVKKEKNNYSVTDDKSPEVIYENPLTAFVGINSVYRGIQDAITSHTTCFSK